MDSLAPLLTDLIKLNKHAKSCSTDPKVPLYSSAFEVDGPYDQFPLQQHIEGPRIVESLVTEQAIPPGFILVMGGLWRIINFFTRKSSLVA
jgi:hypothetical protein